MIEKLYQIDNIRLNYIEGPKNGSPILLVHGNMSRWQSFSPIIPELISNKHVFALDLRGHGKSSHAPGTYTLQNHMLDVISFIKAKIGSPVILLGHSLGGMISLMAAAEYPELIQAIILADSPLTLETLEPILESQQDLGRLIMHYLETKQISKLYQEMNDDFFSESVCACDPDIIRMTFDAHREMLGSYDIERLFPLIKSSVLIMRGQAALGSMISDNDMRKAAALLPQLIQHQIPDVGHSLLTKKEVILQIITEFLSEPSLTV